MEYQVDLLKGKIATRIENSTELDNMFLTSEQAMNREYLEICGKCKWNSHAKPSIQKSNFDGLDLVSVDILITCNKCSFRGAKCTNK